MTDEELNEYLKPEFRTPTAETNVAAAPIATPSAFTGPAGSGKIDPLTVLRQKRRAQAEQVAYDSIFNPDKETSSTSSLVSTKPTWYQGGPPPEEKPGLGALKSLVQSGAANAQKQADLSAKEPLRHFANKVADQNRAGTASMLSGVLGSLIDNKQQNYAQELDAASKQAQMYKTLSGKTGREGSDALGYLNYIERTERNDELQAETERKAELARQYRDPNSEISKSRREALIASGVVTPEQVEGKSGEDLDKMRTAFMQTQAQGNRANEFDRQAVIKQAEELNKANVQQVMHAENEKRDEQRRREQAYVPGVQWAGAPPNQKAVEEVREFKGAHDAIDQAAKQLTEIQERLNQKGLLASAGAGDYRIIEGSLDDEGKALVEQARQAERAAVDAYRKRAQYGALTGREQEFAQQMIQGAGTLRGRFIGRAAWDALRQENDSMVKNLMKSRGAYFEGEAPQAVQTQQDLPSEQLIHRFRAPQQYKRGGQPAEIVSDPLQNSSEPSSSAAPTAPGMHMYEVTTSKGPTRRPLTPQQVLTLTQKLGASNVVLVPENQ